MNSSGAPGALVAQDDLRLAVVFADAAVDGDLLTLQAVEVAKAGGILFRNKN